MLLLYTTTNNGGTAYIAGVKENVSRPQGGNVTTTNTLNHFLSPISFPLSKVKPSFKKKNALAHFSSKNMDIQSIFIQNHNLMLDVEERAESRLLIN